MPNIVPGEGKQNRGKPVYEALEGNKADFKNG